MKNVFIPVFLAVAIIFLLTSCSQTSNISLTNSHNISAYSAVQVTAKTSGSVREELITLPVKSPSPVQTEREDVSENIMPQRAQPAASQTPSTDKDSAKKEQRRSAVVRENHSDVIGIDSYAKDLKYEVREKSVISQPVSSPHNSGQSSHGVPFWLIVICSIIIPPLGVALMFGITDKFWICLALTFCFWLPGMIYALIQVLR
jgi:uncharacterized membrane protein YqaE (UPF0057 family)